MSVGCRVPKWWLKLAFLCCLSLQNHRFTYNEPMRVESCTLSVCDLSLGFGEGGKKQKKMSRPFGVSLLIAGVDQQGPALYVAPVQCNICDAIVRSSRSHEVHRESVYCRWHTDPSGTYVKYEAKSIGAGSEGAQTILQEQYHKVCARCMVERPSAYACSECLCIPFCRCSALHKL